ncbi:hypothetical protein [Alteribacillus sp. HJP-4]|uniref:UPF0738 family protein n=1 Tax=Alteribacillus sp. HJP-4 TaxID=2775394 RepID=UPI0035CCD208
MQHVLTITETKITDNTLILTPIEQWPEQEWKQLNDGMRMLADSDALTFVYVLDSPEAFVQLRLPKRTWAALREAYEHEYKVVADGPSPITLEHFQQEMEYLLDNIPGNGNYGSEMVNAVEKAFHIQ